MEARIEITHDAKKTSTFYNGLVRKSLTSDILVSFANFKKRKALFLFDYKVWKYFWQNIIQKISACVPSISRTFKSSLACVSVLLSLDSTKQGLNPINKRFVTTIDGKLAMPLSAISITSLFNTTKIKATFAVNYAGEICKLLSCLICQKFNNFGHEYKLVYYGMIINEKLINSYRERLSVLAL